MTTWTTATLHDASSIPVLIQGEGPNILLPVRPTPHHAPQAETMRLWGADPDLGPTLITGLATNHRVIAADYEAHRMAHPALETLTPENISTDLLAIADAGHAETFAYYGYSWLALSGLQLALHSPRVRALAMGGFPPIDGPYRAMLAVTRTAHAAAAEQKPAAQPTLAEPGDWDTATIQTTADQTGQFVTLYEALQTFDDAAEQAGITIPRLCFAGDQDTISYSEQWGGVDVRIGPPLIDHQDQLRRQGWNVQILPGLDHMSAMHSAVVLPLLQNWLATLS